MSTYPPAVTLIGCGQWGRNIARVLAELSSLALICDADAARSEPFARSLGVDFTTDFDEALAARSPAVALATPAVTHAALAERALKADKHVYVEKPIALSADDANRLAELADERGRTLMVGHLLQYHPVFVKLLAMVKAGELGTIQYVYSNRLNQGRIRTEENALWSLAPHDLSMILAIAGGRPSVVNTFSRTAVQPEIADIAIATLEFESGLKTHVFCSWLNAYKEHRLTVIGDRGMAVFTDTAANWEDKLFLYAHTVERNSQGPEFKKVEPRRIQVPHSEPLRNEMQCFLDCVSGHGTTLTGPQEAIPVLEVLQAAQTAMDTGRPVRLSER